MCVFKAYLAYKHKISQKERKQVSFNRRLKRLKPNREIIDEKPTDKSPIVKITHFGGWFSFRHHLFLTKGRFLITSFLNTSKISHLINFFVIFF